LNHRDAFLLLQVIGQFAAIISSTRDESEDLPDPSARLAEVMGTTNLDALMFLPVGCLDNLGSWFYLTLLVKNDRTHDTTIAFVAVGTHYGQTRRRPQRKTNAKGRPLLNPVDPTYPHLSQHRYRSDLCLQQVSRR
jgi:hypothetical protein